MGFIDQDVPVPIGSVPPAQSAGVEDLEGELATPPSEPRVNWLFSGVMFGAASWLLVLGVVFAIAGNRIIAGVLFVAMALCALAIWRATRRLKPGRHRSR